MLLYFLLSVRIDHNIVCSKVMFWILIIDLQHDNFDEKYQFGKRLNSN